MDMNVTWAVIWAWVSGGLLHYRPSSKEVPPLSSSTPLISSHVSAGDGTAGLWSSKKRGRTQLEPGPVFSASKSNVRTNESIHGFEHGPCLGNTAFKIRLQKQQNKTSAVGCLPATKSWWCVGANAGGDAGSDRGGSTWGGLCWCCKPVLLEVPAWHSQLLQMEKSNKMID